MKIMARPDGPGCRPSDQTPSGSGGKAASIPRAALSEVRRKAWETRREMYGPQGHRGTYGRGPFGSDPDRMLACLIRLLHEGTLSEGQVAKATGLDRISIRRLEDEHRLQVEDAPQGIEARSAETLGSARQGDAHDAVSEAADALIAYGYKVEPVGDDFALWVVNGEGLTDSDVLALAIRLGLMDSTTDKLQ